MIVYVLCTNIAVCLQGGWASGQWSITWQPRSSPWFSALFWSSPSSRDTRGRPLSAKGKPRHRRHLSRSSTSSGNASATPPAPPRPSHETSALCISSFDLLHSLFITSYLSDYCIKVYQLKVCISYLTWYLVCNALVLIDNIHKYVTVLLTEHSLKIVPRPSIQLLSAITLIV